MNLNLFCWIERYSKKVVKSWNTLALMVVQENESHVLRNWGLW